MKIISIQSNLYNFLIILFNLPTEAFEASSKVKLNSKAVNFLFLRFINIFRIMFLFCAFDYVILTLFRRWFYKAFATKHFFIITLAIEVLFSVFRLKSRFRLTIVVFPFNFLILPTIRRDVEDHFNFHEDLIITHSLIYIEFMI